MKYMLIRVSLGLGLCVLIFASVALGFGGGGGGGGGRGGGGQANLPRVSPGPAWGPDFPIMATPDGAADAAAGKTIEYPGSKSPNPYWDAAANGDPADLNFYRDKNAQLGPPKPGEDRVVFIGDSITENWQGQFNRLFPGKTNYIGRGHTAETTMHMLIRFRQDAVDIGAKVVVLWAGVNDMAGNTGRVSVENVEGNFKSIMDIAKANNIKVVWVSTLASARFTWMPGISDGLERITALYKWQKAYAAANGIYFVDAYTATLDPATGTVAGARDGVHPDNYTTVTNLVAPMIEKALKGEPPTP